jgi:hypothetical protein
MSKLIGLYYGPYLISDTATSKDKTYLGNEITTLICENDKKFNIPTAILEHVITKEKKDLTELRELRVIPVMQQMLTMLVESELTRSEIDYAIGPKMTEALNSSFSLASSKLWGGKDKDDITLMDIQKVLMNDNGKKGTKKSTSK